MGPKVKVEIVTIAIRRLSVTLEHEGFPTWKTVRELAEKNEVPDDAKTEIGTRYYLMGDGKVQVTFSWERPANA